MRRLALALLLSALVISCGGDDSGDTGTEPTVPPSNGTENLGDLEVSTLTTGSEQDADGYVATVGGTRSQSINPTGTVTFLGLQAGQHEVELAGVADNCGVLGDNPRNVSVVAGSVAQTSFTVDCSATTGDLEVTVSTSGEGLDQDGYVITLNAADSWPVGVNGTVLVSGLPPGDYAVELTDIDGNCSVAGDNPSNVSVQVGGTSQVSFQVTCIILSRFALQFSGAQHAETPDHPNLDLSDTWTLETWIRPDAQLVGRQDLISKWGTGAQAAYSLHLDGDEVVLSVRSGSQNWSVVAGDDLIRANVWQHVAAVFRLGEMRVYLDGDLVGQGQAPFTSPQNGTARVSLGREASAGVGFYHGEIDEVRIWNVDRRPNEIQSSMFDQIPANTPGLVAYWRMDEGTGDNAFDLTGNGHDMQLGDSFGADAGDPTWVTPGRP
jgi:hypothetical protein